MSFWSKKGSQGCHISKSGHRNFSRCTSYQSILNPWSIGIINIYGNESDPRRGLWRTSSCNFIIQSLLERFTEMALAQCTVMLWDSSDNNNTSGLVRFNRTSRLLLWAVLLHVEVPEEDHHQHHQGQRHHGHLPRKAAVADPGDHHDALEWPGRLVKWTDATYIHI